MDNIDYEIYKPIRYQEFGEVALTLNQGRFPHQNFMINKTEICFEKCYFKKLVIICSAEIDFKSIGVQFSECFINEIVVSKVLSNNVSLLFFNSVIQGSITAPNLLQVSIDYCFIMGALTLKDLNRVSVGFAKLDTMQEMLFELFLYYKVSNLITNDQNYILENSRIIDFRTKNFAQVFSNGYKPQPDKSIVPVIKVRINFSYNDLPCSTRIAYINISTLVLQGSTSGEIVIEHSKIKTFIMKDFSSQKWMSIWDLSPGDQEKSNSIFNVSYSDLDKVWLEDIAFNQYTLVNFYRNKFGQCRILSCEFPDDYVKFEKFLTVKNVGAPNVTKDDKYFKNRYETFLSLKKAVESSGNIYEAHKLLGVSYDALRKLQNVTKADKIILWSNRESNNHGLSITKPLKLLLYTSIPCYLLYLLSLNRFLNGEAFDPNLIGYYFSFLDLTHKIDFLVPKNQLSGWSVAFDFLNKLTVGYFLYQFIAAFRKYGKK